MSDTLSISLPRPLRAVRLKDVLSSRAESAPEPAPVKTGEDRALALDELRDTAFREGYAKAEGEWAARLSQILMTLEQESARLADCRRDFAEGFQESVVDLALAVAEKFLLSERERRNYAIETIVNDLIERTEHQGGNRLTIALNPGDLKALGDGAGIDPGAACPSVRFTADPTVPLAGCRLDRGLGRVAFSLEEQMDELRTLLATMESPEPEVEPEPEPELSLHAMENVQDE